MAQPGFIEGAWQRFEYAYTTGVSAGSTLSTGTYLYVNIGPEDILRFAGGGILFGGSDPSGKLQLVTQKVYVRMRSGFFFVLPTYPPTQLVFPQDTDGNSAHVVVTLPPIEIPGEALGSGGWPTDSINVRYSVYNSDATNAHAFTVRFSLPFQILSRARTA